MRKQHCTTVQSWLPYTPWPASQLDYPNIYCFLVHILYINKCQDTYIHIRIQSTSVTTKNDVGINMGPNTIINEVWPGYAHKKLNIENNFHMVLHYSVVLGILVTDETLQYCNCTQICMCVCMSVCVCTRLCVYVHTCVSGCAYITTRGIMKQVPTSLLVKYTPTNTFTHAYTHTHAHTH